MGQKDIDGRAALPPEEAFVAIGNEVRIQIIKALCEADRPLAFSELFERVDYFGTLTSPI